VQVIPQPGTVRSAPQWFRNDRFVNEKNKCLRVPSYRCSVCCRLLYEDDDVCVMSEAVERQIVEFLREEQMKWPVMYYRDERGIEITDVQRKGRQFTVVVCASHKSSGNNSVRNIKEFVSIGLGMVFLVLCW
jgi:hypothetical protein